MATPLAFEFDVAACPLANGHLRALTIIAFDDGQHRYVEMAAYRLPIIIAGPC
jgi:hypothetical protein